MTEDDSMTCWWTARRAGTVLAMIAAAGSMLTLVAALPALAQAWPSKTVRIIVPFSPGSATDLLPRAIFEHVSAKLGQTFIVENRPGGGGGIGVSAVAKSDPDGHTLLVHSNALVTAPAIQAMPYDPVQDFAGITPLGNVPLVLVISPDKNIKTLKEIRRRREGQARLDELCGGRHRHAAASDHGALPLGGGLHRADRAVQGRAGGSHRGARRPRRRLFLTASARGAVHPERSAYPAGGEQR
ncbi:MAG: Bug family tripartite tricarboxylate transporter substrate binding protein, partial [Burkholderiales bacterium]